MINSKSFSLKESVSYELIDSKTGLPVFFGDDISVSYTLEGDDITGARLSSSTPYESRRGDLSFKERTENGYILHNPTLLTELQLTFEEDRVFFTLSTALNELSEFGLNLPFNFMGKMNGGSFDKQYLFNSPYRSLDNRYKYCYLNSIKGSNILIAFLSEADGWKMDYSPWVGGHYFVNLKCLANFDKLYKTGSKHKTLKLVMLFVDDLEDGISKLSKLLELPILYYDKSYSFNGKGVLKVIGACDSIEYVKDKVVIKTQANNGDVFHYSEAEGKVSFVPYYKGRKGLDCSVFAYNSLDTMFKLSNDSILTYPEDNLGNLCEQQFWASAMLRFMIANGQRENYNAFLNIFFQRLFPENEADAIERFSVFKESKAGFPAYSVYKSNRIQEHFAGVSILLDAYKLYRNQSYLEYAVGMLNSLLDHYQKENGGIFTSFLDACEDYSTVTCLRSKSVV